MPTRNAIKQYAAESFYHVYSRGVNKQRIFHDDEDYAFYISLFKRYLSLEPTKRSKHPPYHHFRPDLQLLTYCLMPNHVHLLVHQNDNAYAIQDFMRAVMTSYSKYYNQKYERLGPLFQSRYLASRIDNDPYLLHISRYIHRNPKEWRKYPFSSLKYFTGSAQAEWIDPAETLQLFENSLNTYMTFLADYQPRKSSEIDFLLAHE